MINEYYEESEEENDTSSSAGGEESGSSEQQNGESGGGLGNDIKNKAAEKAKKELAQKAKKEFAKKAASHAAAHAAGGSLMAALAPILPWIALVIVIIVVLIGIIMFLITMPGMVMEQLNDLFENIGQGIAGFFGIDSTKRVDEVQIYETLDYLEQMGWDIKNEGFLTDYMEEKDADSKEGEELDTELGVVRNEDGNIVDAKSDVILTYIISDNYVYTVKNENLAMSGADDSFIEKLGGVIFAYAYRIYSQYFGPLFHIIGVDSAVGEHWGRRNVGILL